MCPKTADKWCDRWKQGAALEEGAGDVVSLALLIKFSASFLQCLWKYNFVRDIHVQLRIV